LKEQGAIVEDLQSNLDGRMLEIEDLKSEVDTLKKEKMSLVV